MKDGTATATKTAKMAITTMISTKLKPLLLNLLSFTNLVVFLMLIKESEDIPVIMNYLP